METVGEIVRATGLCSVCDFKFINEVVARYPAPSMPAGWAYAELRHLSEDEIEELGVDPCGLPGRDARSCKPVLLIPPDVSLASSSEVSRTIV